MFDEHAKRWQKMIKLARREWPVGPWTLEPDRTEWRFQGVPCLMVRSVVTGAWCGYAGVTAEHPLFGVRKDDLPCDLAAHGGINFADHCGGPVCHEPAPGESDAVYWIGFDCAHAFDCCPAMVRFGRGLPLGTYRDETYVRAQVERLAAQLAEMECRHG